MEVPICEKTPKGWPFGRVWGRPPWSFLEQEPWPNPSHMAFILLLNERSKSHLPTEWDCKFHMTLSLGSQGLCLGHNNENILTDSTDHGVLPMRDTDNKYIIILNCGVTLCGAQLGAQQSLPAVLSEPYNKIEARPPVCKTMFSVHWALLPLP